MPDQAGQPSGAALAPALLAGNEWVGVIETVPNAVFMAPAASIRNTSLLVGLIAMLCAAVLALLVARSLTRPIRQLTAAVEGVGQQRPVAIPLDASGETGVLARAFARVMDEVKAKTAALEREVQEHRRTEAARDHLAERERLFSAAVESSNDAIVTQSLDGTITGWNPAAERLFGYSAEEAVGQEHHPDRAPRPAPEVQDTLRRIGRGETDRALRNRAAAQGRQPGRSLAQHLADQEAVGRDRRRLEDRARHDRSRQTEQALRQQTEERRRIFETSQDLIMSSIRRGFWSRSARAAKPSWATGPRR